MLGTVRLGCTTAAKSVCMHTSVSKQASYDIRWHMGAAWKDKEAIVAERSMSRERDTPTNLPHNYQFYLTERRRVSSNSTGRSAYLTAVAMQRQLQSLNVG